MRGCLFVVVLGLVVLAVASAGAWFAAPPLAASLVRGALTSAGFETVRAPEVDVSFASPAELLAGRATTVRVWAGGGSVGGIGWRAADIELGAVELLSARFATVALGLEAPTFRNDAEAAGLAALWVTARGSADRAETRVAISPEQIRQAGRVPFLRLGGVAGDLRLAAPDRVTGELSGVPFSAVARVDSGVLVIDPDAAAAPTVELFRPPDNVPFTMESVEVEAGNLVIVGTLDVAAMLGR